MKNILLSLLIIVVVEYLLLYFNQRKLLYLIKKWKGKVKAIKKSGYCHTTLIYDNNIWDRKVYKIDEYY